MTGVSGCTGKGCWATPGLITNTQHHTGFPQQGSTPPGCFRLYSRHPGSNRKGSAPPTLCSEYFQHHPGVVGKAWLARMLCMYASRWLSNCRASDALSLAALPRFYPRPKPHQFEAWHKVARTGLGVVRKPEPGEVVRLHELHLRRHRSIQPLASLPCWKCSTIYVPWPRQPASVESAQRKRHLYDACRVLRFFSVRHASRPASVKTYRW